MQYTIAAIAGLAAIVSASPFATSNGTNTANAVSASATVEYVCESGSASNCSPVTLSGTAAATAVAKSCQASFDSCRTAYEANHATCAAEYAACLGYNPFTTTAANASVTASVGDALYFTTEVVTSFTTYCPAATTLTFNGKTYTVTSATTLTVTDCPCTLTKTAASTAKATTAPAGSAIWKNTNTTAVVSTMTKGAYTTTEVVKAYTTYCPSSTVITAGSTTISVTGASTVVVPQHSTTKAVSAETSVVTGVVVVSSGVAKSSGSSTRTGSTSSSTMAVYEGAAAHVAGGVSSLFIAVAAFFL